VGVEEFATKKMLREGQILEDIGMNYSLTVYKHSSSCKQPVVSTFKD